MIIECQNCNKKFDLEDKLMPLKGRLVQCGFCHSQWHQLPNIITSSLKKKVIDIFDTNININAFREYKPYNKNYDFFIIKPDFDKILLKINKFL